MARLHPVVGDILAVRVQVELALQTVPTPFHVLKHNQYFRARREALIYYETRAHFREALNYYETRPHLREALNHYETRAHLREALNHNKTRAHLRKDHI